jgi:hypothetical protein
MARGGLGHTVIDLTVPALELGFADTVLGSNGVTLVTGYDQVEAITISCDSRHSR